jgi:hypothetical protein
MKNIRSMEFKDGLEFLKDAKSRFIQENKKDKYDDFVRLLISYKEKRFDHIYYHKLFFVL